MSTTAKITKKISLSHQKLLTILELQPLREKCPNTEYFLVRIFLYSDWIQENTYQKNLCIWTLFTQWAFSCINLIKDSLQKKFPSQFNNHPVFYIWSDGCASQFWSRFVFGLMTHFNPDYNIQWYYNKRHHGKNPMDSVGEPSKIWFFNT